jgi:hypothetical protein
VIRRDRKILLLSKRRARALLLYFKSLEDCLSFSDKFVELNPPETSTRGTAVVVDTRQKQKQKQPPPPRARQQTKQQNQQETEEEEQQKQQQQQQQQQDDVVDVQQRIVNGTIARLLYDEDFLRFVHKIEQYVTSTRDGAQMLMGLEQRDLTSL